MDNKSLFSVSYLFSVTKNIEIHHWFCCFIGSYVDLFLFGRDISNVSIMMLQFKC